MKTPLLIFSLSAALLLGGCGGDGTTETDATDITVERGPVLMATVLDADGQRGEHLGNGVYRFHAPHYPVSSYGGYIDVNRNGVVDSGDVSMGRLRLHTDSGTVMTLATTTAQNRELYTYMRDLGFSDEELLQATPSTDRDTAALSDELYKQCIENNISDPAQLEYAAMVQIGAQIRERRERYNASDLSTAELEEQLVSDELRMERVSDEDTTRVRDDNDRTVINSIEASELTPEQMFTLAYMWNEERLAHDLYLALDALYPSQTLENIATRSESSHIASVEALIEKYDLNILNTDDFSGGYDAAALDAFEPGTYSLEAIADLYETLYGKGSQSLQDALEVGCMVEVTDINDLNEDIAAAEGADDLVLVYENLREGSYNHYWAFDRALKGIGVTEGCCSLGDAYCKTAEEYPQTSMGSGMRN
jgi:hypothetical protein